MKFLKLLRYQIVQSGTLILVCIIFPIILVFFNNMDLSHDKRTVDTLIKEYGSIEAAMDEDPEAIHSLESRSSADPSTMLVAGLFGGSVGLIVELFGIAMQMGISRKSIRWSYLLNALTFTVLLSLLVWATSIVIKEYFISQATGDYAILKTKYEGIDTGFLELLKYIMIGFPVMISGAAFWLITTRLKNTVLWVVIMILVIAGTIFGITFVILEYEAIWLAYVIGGAASLIMTIFYFVLISTETVEHKLR